MASTKEMIERFKKEAPLETALPYRFSNGFLLTEITGQCKSCKKEVTGEHVRGIANKGFHDVFSFDDHGICTDCKTIFSIHGRVKPHKDAARQEYVKNGVWVTAFPFEEAKPIDKLRAALLRLLTFFRLV